MMHRLIAASLIVCVSLLGTNIAEGSIALNLDFGNGNLAPSSAYGAASGQTGSWNRINNAITGSGIVDTSGAATAVTVNINAGTMGGLGAALTGDAALLMQDNFYSNPGDSWSLTIAGLMNGAYDVYLYDPNHTSVGTGGGAINGVSFAPINGAFAGAFVEGGNYLKISGVSVTNGTMSGTAISSTAYSGLAGMQIVPLSVSGVVPEPISLLVWGGLAATMGMTFCRRRSL